MTSHALGRRRQRGRPVSRASHCWWHLTAGHAALRAAELHSWPPTWMLSSLEPSSKLSATPTRDRQPGWSRGKTYLGAARRLGDKGG